MLGLGMGPESLYDAVPVTTSRMLRLPAQITSRVSALLLHVALFSGCAVDPSGLPADDAAVSSCAQDPNVCNDGVECTRDSCGASGVCARTADDSLCGSGEVCDETAGCLAESSCDALDCREALENALACQVGACQSDGTCLGQSVCDPGEVCCGDGSCEDCDDDNPCTEDSCDAGGCINTPLTGTACDDGDFCSGTETCDAGVCVSSGDPCESPTVCDVDRCVGCRNAGDCPDPIMPPFGSCQFGGDTCVQTGTRRRTVTTFACVDRECVGTDARQMEACSRNTDANVCGTDMVGSWGACDYGGSSCANRGTRTRQRTIYRCADGSCDSRNTTDSDMAACDRNTNGTMCGATTVGGWGACMGFSEMCDETGTRSRTDVVRECASGSCGMRNSPVTEACTRAQDGMSCGADVVTTTECMRTASDDPCSEAGMRQMITETFVCGDDTCGSSTTTVMVSCMVDTDGVDCDPGNPCGGVCANGACDLEARNGDSCDDGLDCNSGDECSGGVCAGTADGCNGSDCSDCGGGACDCVAGGSAGMCACT